MSRTQKKAALLAVAALLTMSAAIPVAHAVHLSYYMLNPAGDSHAALATFEGSPDTTPSDDRVPAAFRNLGDKLVSTVGYNGATTGGVAGVDGAMVMDGQYQEMPAHASPFVPYNYYLDQNLGSGDNRLSPDGIFMAWHGYWWDMNGDGAIDDVQCKAAGFSAAMDATNPHRCKDSSGTDVDEFVVRGIATGESGIEMVGYMFPTDGSVGFSGGDAFGSTSEPKGFAGNCNKWSDSGANCYSPEPDFGFSDRSSNGQAEEIWIAENGFGGFFHEEFLVSGLDFITLSGAGQASGAEGYDVACANSGATCLRDYDHYEALAGDDVSALYLTSLHIVRDLTWQNQAPFNNGVTDPVTGDYTVDRARQEGFPVPDVCPYDPAVPGVDGGEDIQVCQQNTAHLDGEPGYDGGGAPSSELVYAGSAAIGVVPAFTKVETPFLHYWCAQAATPAGEEDECTRLSGNGIYGDYLTMGPARSDVSDARTGAAWIRGGASAFRWDDVNGDGYWGAPSEQDKEMYASGLDNNINTQCFKGQSDSCELVNANQIYASMLLAVWPCAEPAGGTCVDGAWPPGTFVSRNYEKWSINQPFLPDSETQWLEASAPAFSGAPVYLRFDPADCNAGTVTVCRTSDGIVLPGGSASTLSGLATQVLSGTVDLSTGQASNTAPGVTMTWNEGTSTFTYEADITSSHPTFVRG